MKYSIILIGAMFVLLCSSVARADAVIWLKDVEPLLARSFKAVQKIIDEDESFTEFLSTKLGANSGGVTIDYNAKIHKLFVRAKVLVVKKGNSRMSCRATINQLKTSIFSENPHWGLEDIFYRMDKKDRRYFVKIAANIQSYGIRIGHATEIHEITNYTRPIPRGAKLLRRTRCTSNLLSDEIFFN